MSRIIGVVSGKGGVGKTTIVANLGVALTKFNARVTLVDCNITTSHLGFCFGLYYYPKTLNDVLRGDASILDVAYPYGSIKIVPASLSVEELIGVDIDRLESCIEGLDKVSDVILLDSAPGLGREALSVLNASDEVLFVTIPTLPAVKDVMKCGRVVRELGLKQLGVILNMVKGTGLKERVVEELTSLPVLAKIPYDPDFERSLEIGRPMIAINPDSKASEAMMRLAADLTGQAYSRRPFLSRLLGKFKRIFT